MKSLEPVSKKSKKKQCIVRYAGLGPYSELKDVNEEKEARIGAAKARRETLKGRNHHEEQCLLVPDNIQDATHGVHMTPCYKKFTLILAGESSGHQNNQRLSKGNLDGNSTWVYPEVCCFCKKGRMSYRGKKVGLAKLEMKEAELLIKQRAQEKNLELFYEIEYLDLTAKNFWFHEYCRKDFTRPKKSSDSVS